MSVRYHSYSQSPVLAIPSPPKQPAAYTVSYARRDISRSPPEASDTVSSAGSSGRRSTASSVSYDGRPASSDSSSSDQVDLLSYMDDRLAATYDPLPLDRSLAAQAQSSGALNAKTRELMELQRLAQSRLASTRATFAEGIRTARDVKRDLEWTQSRVTKLNHRAAMKYPDEYRRAAERYPRVVDDE